MSIIRLTPEEIHFKTQAQGILKRLVLQGLYKIRGLTFFYTIVELETDVYTVFKNELKGFDEQQYALSDKEVCSELLYYVLFNAKEIIM